MSPLTLADTPASLPRALPAGQTPAALHAAVSAEVAAHLGPAHAALLSRPVPEGDALRWQAPGTDALRLSDLPPDGRRALLAALGSILSDLRRLAESGRAPRLREAWPAIRLVPDLSAVWAVDGRPVLADWGRGGTGGDGLDPLAEFDDRRPFVPADRVPWRPWAAGLAACLVLALLAFLAGPVLLRPLLPAASACRADPGQLGLMREAAAEEARGQALQAQLAAANDDVGRKQLLCPIPTVQRAPSPQPAPQPSPQPPPRPQRQADLPADRWERRDISLLEGCWRSSTRLRTRSIATGQVSDVSSWKLCFDRNGRGQQDIRWTDGKTCSGPQEAAFRPDNALVLTDTSRCNGPGADLMRGRFECRRVSDTEATCTRTDTEGPATGSSQTGRFTR